jgi:hypothetical protein
LYPRSSNSNRFFGVNHRPDSGTSNVLIADYRSLWIAFQMFLDYLECLRDFGLQITEVSRQRRALGIDHHIHGNATREGTQPHSLAQAASDSISLDRAAQRLTDCEADSRALCLIMRALQVKHCHVCRKLPAALLVNSLKIRMTQQPMALRKLALRSILGPLIHFHSCSGQERPSPKKTGF